MQKDQVQPLAYIMSDTESSSFFAEVEQDIESPSESETSDVGIQPFQFEPVVDGDELTNRRGGDEGLNADRLENMSW